MLDKGRCFFESKTGDLHAFILILAFCLHFLPALAKQEFKVVSETADKCWFVYRKIAQVRGPCVLSRSQKVTFVIQTSPESYNLKRKKDTYVN
jgi:hypothetical protein